MPCLRVIIYLKIRVAVKGHIICLFNAQLFNLFHSCQLQTLDVKQYILFFVKLNSVKGLALLRITVL